MTSTMRLHIVFHSSSTSCCDRKSGTERMTCSSMMKNPTSSCIKAGRVDNSVAGVVDRREVRIRVNCVCVVSPLCPIHKRSAHFSVLLVISLQLRLAAKRFVNVDALVQRLEVHSNIIVIQSIDYKVVSRHQSHACEPSLTVCPLVVDQFETSSNSR